MRSNSGVALVAVLWGVVLLAVLTTGVIALTRTENRRQSIDLDRVRDEAAIDSAIVAVVQRLSGAGAGRQSLLGGAPVQIDLSDSRIEVQIEFESGRIDINAANDRLLAALAESAGLTRRDSDSWLAKLRDWQDRKDDRRLNGAEASDYRGATPPYGPRKGPLKSIPELRLVLGMTDRLYACLESAITVYTQTSTPDVSRLTARARLAWTLYEKEQSLESLPSPSRAASDWDPTGQVLRLTAGVLAEGYPTTRVVVVGRLTGDRTQPWTTLGLWIDPEQFECKT